MSTTSVLTAPQPELHAVRKEADWCLRAVILVTTALSIAAYVYFSHLGVVLGYKDSISHLQIAQRVINSPTAGFAQLGGVWLPLPHLLMLPLVWIDPLYYNGFAGSCISMISYVVTAMFVYKIVLGLTKARVPAIAGVAVFALNPNMLYMQSTPMTELLLFATITAMVYYVQQWIQTERYQSLFMAGFAALLGCLTRYEAWLFTFVLTCIVFAVALKRHGWQRADGTVVSFVFFAWASIVGWIGWNQLILGDALYWKSGEYAKSSLWVDSQDPSVGHLVTAIKTYSYAILHDFGWPVVVLSLLGLVALCLLKPKADMLPTLGLLVFFPFFVYSIWSAERPLNVIETSGNLYNLRFALIMGLFAAIAIGVLVGVLPRPIRVIGLVVAALCTVSLLMSGGTSNIITIKETQFGLQRTINIAPNGVSDFLRQNYDGGKLLAESFGNETILFDARISLGMNIYEGSNKLWEPALHSPAEHDIQWIIMRRGDVPDRVYQTLNGSSQLDSYTLAYSNDTYFVYKRK